MYVHIEQARKNGQALCWDYHICGILQSTCRSTFCNDTILNQKANYEAGKPVYCIYVAVGQKGSTVANIVNVLKERGALDYTIVVAATAADPAALQYFAPLAGAAIGVGCAFANIYINRWLNKILFKKK